MIDGSWGQKCPHDFFSHKIRKRRKVMMILKKDETNRVLGKKSQTCRICGEKGNFDTYLVQEMMQGTREEFEYFVCDRCQCLQIAEIPENLGDYYGENYYSFQVAENPDLKFEKPVFKQTKVLDVGCGGGAWLLQKAMEGWGNLYGCDPFLEKDRHFGQRVTIRNCSIHEMEGDATFDIIHMSDSFEHMTDPLEVLKSVRRLLKSDGYLYMSIPTYPNIAFEQFGTHWYQLDAPRHIFLHSKKSLEWLAKASGMMVSNIHYNSNTSQFIRSYFYQHGVSFFEQEKLVSQYFREKEYKRLEKEANIWNEKEYGDHMEVYWQKNNAVSIETGTNVIFQKFSGTENKRLFPYPPLYREPNTDYICFTDNANVYSSDWKIEMVDSLEEADFESYLEQYENRWELEPEQIQMGPLFASHIGENFLTVPALDTLPLVKKLDLEKFASTADSEGNYIYRKNPVYQKGKYNGRPLLLTIGVPVSNQISTIDRCLSHIKPLLDQLDSELIAIDTGSTDGTIEVCKSYGARVISHPWCDNMSAVRNEGIYHAKGQWYLSIDDDEWFEDVDDILKFFKQGIYRKFNMANYIQRNYTNSKGTLFEDFHTLRMAEITPELHFEGRIHDALVRKGGFKICMLNSYAHHYGFVADQPKKRKEKFMRNTSILLYDIYEYPENYRYLFQLANEYSVIGLKKISVELFAQVIALARVVGNGRREHGSLVKLFHGLYDMGDPRLFSWIEYLKDLFPLSTAEQAGLMFLQEALAFQMRKPAGEVLKYYHSYKKLQKQYKEDSDLSQFQTFAGLSLVEHDYWIMDAKAVAFCCYLRVGEEEKALELLDQISLEVIENRRIAVLSAGLSGEERTYQILCEKLTAIRWEEWSEEILDAFVVSFSTFGIYQQQAERFPDLLVRISVPSILSWIQQSEIRRKGKIGMYLFKYAMECEIGNENPIQELCLCAWILKEEYIKRRNDPNSKEILYRYVTVFGVFAERYYNLDCLIDADSHVVPPDICAIYRMAVVLADGTATSENIAVLKQALEIFPSFHEEIRIILMGLSRTEISRNN